MNNCVELFSKEDVVNGDAPDILTNEEIANKFPSPFKEAILFGDFSIDYKLHKGKSDHTWLKNHGYTTKMGGDCSYYVENVNWLNATSYGDWGSVYVHNKKLNVKCFELFLQMYEEGILYPWRIRVYINKEPYDYDDEAKTWKTYTGKSWITCDSPFKFFDYQ